MKLENKRNWQQIVSGIIFIPGAICGLLVKFEFPTFVIAIVTFVAFVLSAYFWLVNGLKPSAWIDNDVLYIRDGSSTPIQIPKVELESMRYCVPKTRDKTIWSNREKQVHNLIVKRTGFQEWDVPIKDGIGLQQDMRLYHFIKDHFYNIEYVKN